VSWLPGDAVALASDQLKQAMCDDMPAKWKERFVNAGKSSGQQTMPELVNYFRSQERLAALKQRETLDS
jgi:hypothetical protein